MELLFFLPKISLFWVSGRPFFRGFATLSELRLCLSELRLYRWLVTFDWRSSLNDNTTSKIHCFYFNSIIVPWYHCEFDQESGATAKVVFTEINFSQLSSIIQSNTNVTAVAGVLQCHISDPDKDVNTWKRTTIPWQRGGDVRLCNPHNWVWRGCLVRDVE